MKKVKESKNILLIAGIAASIVMILIVLYFSLNPTNEYIPITGNSINLREITSSSDGYTKQEINTLLGEKCQEMAKNKSINDTLIIELTRKGNTYLCIKSE